MSRPEFVTIASAAKYLGISDHAARRWVATGVLPSTRDEGRRRYMVPSDALDNPGIQDMALAHQCAHEARRKIDNGFPLSALGHRGWYTREEAAHVHCVKPETIDLWRREEILECRKVGRMYLYPAGQVPKDMERLHNGKYLRSADVAELLDCPVWKVNAMVKQGRLERVDVASGVVVHSVFPKEQFNPAMTRSLKSDIRSRMRHGGAKVGHSGYIKWTDNRIVKLDRDIICLDDVAERMIRKKSFDTPHDRLVYLGEIKSRLFQWADRGVVQAKFFNGNYWFLAEDMGGIELPDEDVTEEIPLFVG